MKARLALSRRDKGRSILVAQDVYNAPSPCQDTAASREGGVGIIVIDLVVDNLDAITIQVQDCSIEDAIIAASEGRRSVRSPTSSQCSGVKVSHRRFAGCGECHMSIATGYTMAILISLIPKAYPLFIPRLTQVLPGSRRSQHRQCRSQPILLDCPRICIQEVGVLIERTSRQKEREKLSSQRETRAWLSVERKRGDKTGEQRKIYYLSALICQFSRAAYVISSPPAISTQSRTRSFHAQGPRLLHALYPRDY